MKPKADFDPMFRSGPRRRHRTIAWIGLATIVMGVGGLSLRAGPLPLRPPVSRLPIAPNRAASAAQQPDRFVIVAPAELDAAMVVRARADIDPQMVFNPETRRRGSGPSDPAPVIIAPIPTPRGP
jgi:hypothetical protein